MRVGVYLPQRSMDRTLLDAARDAEALGFASVAVIDHVVPIGRPDGTPVLDSFSALAAVAAVTVTIGLRTLVVRAGLRPPAMTAHLARTAAALAPDRLVLGLGTGDAAGAREDRLLGLPERAQPERRRQLRAVTVALRAAVPGVPLWYGGAGPAVRRLAGELADGWNVWAATPDEIRVGAADLAAAAAAAGRPAPVVTWAGQVLLADSDPAAATAAAAWHPGRAGERERALVGGPETVAARLRALADAGVSEAVVAFVGGAAAGQRRNLARRVLPLL